MKSDWHIRRATAADADPLKRCMESAYSAYQARMGGERLPPMDVDYRAEIRNFPAWVVESKHRVVGGLIMDFENDQAWIANIAIDRDSQGQGIGGGLLRFAESQASSGGCTELRLATHVLLTENLALYRHLGWKESGRCDNKVLMVKKL